MFFATTLRSSFARFKVVLSMAYMFGNNGVSIKSTLEKNFPPYVTTSSQPGSYINVTISEKPKILCNKKESGKFQESP